MTQLMKSHPGMVEEVISMLRHMEIDGETMQYILKEVAMEDQMLKQLISTANESDLDRYLLIHLAKNN